jgi:transcriptional regulator with XRE-family HTH domain
MSEPQVFRGNITEFARAVWSIRKHCRMGQTAFAAVIGVTPSQISRYESGLSKPDLKPLLKLLCEARTPIEQHPILQQLKDHGLDDVLRCLRLAGLLSQPSPTHTVCNGHEREATPQVQVPLEEGL